MRIGYFTDTYTPQINGVVTSMRLFKRALEARGHELYVFAPQPEHHDDGDMTVRFPSVPFVFQREMRMAAPLSISALRTLDTIGLDVIHSHDPFSIGLFGLSYARRRKITHVHTYHTLYPEYVHYIWETKITKQLARRLSREFCNACDSIVAPSTKIQLCLTEWGVNVPIEVIATGIDVERYAKRDDVKTKNLRERLAISTGDRVLLFVGRLGREKNIEMLLHSLTLLSESRALLLIVGDGPHRPELEALVSQLGLQERVRFAGYLQRDDVIAAYQLSTLLAFASTSETQGLVIGEAMATGLPVVAVEDHAVEDFVVDGRTGYVVPERAVDLAVAIDRLLDDDIERAAFSDASRLRAEVFAIERQAEQLENHYQRSIESFAPSRPLTRRPTLPRPRKNTGLHG